MTATVTTEMTLGVAQAHIQKIKNHTGEIRVLVWELYEYKGWKVLGYSNWTECIAAEFGENERHMYKLLEAAQIEKNLTDVNHCPIGHSLTDVKHSKLNVPYDQLRPLKNLQPDQQRAVYKEAVKTAPNGKMTAKHVEETKKAIIRPVSFDHEPKTPEMTDEEKVIKRFKIWVSALSQEKQLTKSTIHQYISKYLL